MPGRRTLMLACLAATTALAGGGGIWLATEYGTDEVETPPAASVKIGAPFRSSDSGRSRVTLVSSHDGEGAAFSPSGNSAEIVKLLSARGFSEITNLRQRGGTFICEATGPRRERVRLVLDSASGEVSGIQVIGFGEPRP